MRCMSNPNFPNLSKFWLVPVTAMALGTLGCAASESPTPTSAPSPHPTTAEKNDDPQCTGLDADFNPQNPRQVAFRVSSRGIEGSGKYTIDRVRIDYGDGGLDFSASHEYSHADKYPVSAAIILGVSRGAGGTTHQSGEELPCPQLIVEVP
jgi:hypothetical protein